MNAIAEILQRQSRADLRPAMSAGSHVSSNHPEVGWWLVFLNAGRHDILSVRPRPHESNAPQAAKAGLLP
eukprot:scaffold228254_cov46-Prasinocladus_malaysianus.AAC.1